MSIFETHPKSLKSELLGLIHAREMALPDFQRDFVWQPGQTLALIVSLAKSFPAGSLLRMENGGSLFAPRAIAGAPVLNGHAPKYLILDGQQRLTSLYQALYGTGDHLFYVRLTELVGQQDFDKAFFYELRDRGQKQYGTPLTQGKARVLPLQVIFGGDGFYSWLDEIDEALEQVPGGAKLSSKERKDLRTAYDDFVAPIVNYEFPVVTLTGNPSLEAVCTIFETLNNTGVRLSVFDLLSARYYAKNENLRERWTRALAETTYLESYEVDPYYILQVMSARKKNSIKRSDVLNLDVTVVAEHWDDSVWGMDEALRLLHDDCGVLKPGLLSYYTILVPLAAVFAEHRHVQGPALGALRSKLKRWYWCSVFGQKYETNPTSQSITDVTELRGWIEDGAEPESVASFAFDAESLRLTTTRQRAIYRGILCLVLRRPPLDFHTGKKLTAQLMADGKVDDHHIFPAGFLKTYAPDLDAREIDAIVNRTLIDRITNEKIGKLAPSVYLKNIRDEQTQMGLDAVLESHYIPTGESSSLWRDQYDEFRKERIAALASLIQQATGTTT